MMPVAISNNIKVSVETIYQESYSKPLEREFVHAYRITIENLGDYTVQLLRRHWIIWDAATAMRKVDGEGVVGQQPILQPGESYQYVSGCPLKSEQGKMEGSYAFVHLASGDEFEVEIPLFYLYAPFKLN